MISPEVNDDAGNYLQGGAGGDDGCGQTDGAGTAAVFSGRPDYCDVSGGYPD
ncbi:hypothetical protein METHB2_310019 [Candidatus Methylobacter favarea]|uniref:Uncharacterized protein n=1 Tax=Candidatus Methylobacter favarea TaxID=2707345 RepID=A0A8S0X127_9GAMM|nr:hypothetical protein METHB2_310019 [Candidatus Methylobacter favarea]